ncbi:AAA family ATPase [Corynebacterium pseudopelargi]|nr:AAA family ATPase [Corynebacterium pseudopelargi]
MSETTTTPEAAPGIACVPATKIQPRQTRWIIDDWVPANALTLIAGSEGIGKSTIAARFAADLSTGRVPGAGAMRVLYVSTEDDPASTTVPRLIAAGADLGNVMLVDQSGFQRPMTLPRDMAALEALVDRFHIEAVILDPVGDLMATELNANSAQDVRAFLTPLTRLAVARNLIVLAIAHHGKVSTGDAARAILGSRAWSQVPRSVLTVAHDESCGGLIVTNTKSNLARRVVSRTATIETAHIGAPGLLIATSKLEWGEETDRDARDLMDADKDDTRAARKGVDAWLREALTPGAVRSKTLFEDAKGAGWSQDQIKRAKIRLGIKADRDGHGWYWHLPGAPSTPPTPDRKDTNA